MRALLTILTLIVVVTSLCANSMVSRRKVAHLPGGSGTPPSTYLDSFEYWPWVGVKTPTVDFTEYSTYNGFIQ